MPTPLLGRSSNLLPWIGLYTMAAVAAYGLQIVATPRSADAASQPVATSASALTPPPLEDPRLTYVTIVVDDRATGTESSSLCLTRKEQVATDVMVVFAEDAKTLTSAMCQPYPQPSGGG
jgi:hypothetical protein